MYRYISHDFFQVAPFGGVKQSGLGREGSKYGMDDYLEVGIQACKLVSLTFSEMLICSTVVADQVCMHGQPELMLEAGLRFYLNEDELSGSLPGGRGGTPTDVQRILSWN